MAPTLSWWVLTLIIALAEVSLGSDIRCTRKRGKCQNIYTATCAGYYDSSPICDGPAERQCCVPQPRTLKADTRCTQKNGKCQNIYTATCAGYYDSSPICGGPAERQCCVPQPRTYSDGPCSSKGGVCQVDSGPCLGRYQTGLCGGPADRRCCLRQQTATAAPPSSNDAYSCYGDVRKLRPKGASAKTARQDGLTSGGVAASQRMARNDYNELNKRKQCYVNAGRNHCIHPAVIAGIASRESRGGKLLYATGGWGDRHRAYGIMQCDGAASGLGSTCTSHPWDSCQHIDMMVRLILLPFVKTIRAKFPSWTPEQQLQGGVSAYNAGTRNVQSFDKMDVGTTGNDYANDVIARAQYLISNYNW